MPHYQSPKFTPLARGMAAASFALGMAGACLVSLHTSYTRPANPSSPVTTAVSLVSDGSRPISSHSSLLTALPQPSSSSDLHHASRYSSLSSFWQWLLQFWPPTPV